MRLWSLHPRYLDARGLVALWREALLAQAVLAGRTRGYTRHPQLRRFLDSSAPTEQIAAYLRAVHDEAVLRGYRFDATKIGPHGPLEPLVVTTGQLDFEWSRLATKLATRDPQWWAEIALTQRPQPHPSFRVVDGDVAPWEVLPADAPAVGRLVVDAVAGVTDIVEEMHRNIAGLSPIVGASPQGRAKGIPGLVYRSVRGVTRAVGFGLDATLARLSPWLDRRSASTPAREAVLAALNGVLGDYLEASGNALAIPMRLRRSGHALPLERAALTNAVAQPNNRLLVLVHGLCMNDLEWRRDGHDHGASLAEELGYAALYLHYNSGRPIDVNGREFADTLERLVSAWPVPVREVVIIGHSMGGLVARSACHHARQARHAWLQRLTTLVFLGTPHHGAPLERAGNRANLLLAISPYTAPFARLGRLRSAGIRDLRHGDLRHGEAVPLPAGVRCYAGAASRQRSAGQPGRRVLGDGLVPVDSALGRHADPARSLAIPPDDQAIFYGVNHLGLLGSRAVYERIRDWLNDDAREQASRNTR